MQQHKTQNQRILKIKRYQSCDRLIFLGSMCFYMPFNSFFLMVLQTQSFHQNAKLSLKLELPEILDGS